MSATTSGGWASSGRVRAGLVFGLPVLALAGIGYWTWAGGRAVSPVPESKSAMWPVARLPETPKQRPAPAPEPAKVEPAKIEPAPPPARVAVMRVHVEASAMQAATDAAATRWKEAMQPRSSAGGGGGGTNSGSDVLAPGGGNSEYAQRMQATTFANITPVPPRFNKLYTIKKGYRIPCLPDHPLGSEMVGPVKCMTTQAVLSMEGDNVLLPAGTEINGTIERGLGGGERRLGPIWTDMLTPKPLSLAIPLNAPTADELGQTGVPGDVNTHFWAKTGTLALVGGINALIGVASSAANSGNGNTTLNLGSQANGISSLAERAFGAQLSQSDTLGRAQGQSLLIVTNQYIDLSNYYQDRVIRR